MEEDQNTEKLKTVNVVVPEEVYWHVRQCAIESRLSMKDYMAIFCREARPYPVDRAEEQADQEHPGGSPKCESE
jgi:hypothetical protein